MPVPTLYGSPTPRLAPPVPARVDLDGFRTTAQGLGITLMPWQETAARYLTATNADGRRLYKEVAVVVARQNGKTTLVKPLIIQALRAGRRVMHIAQNRELPRSMFAMIAASLEESLFLKRRGKGGKMQTVWPRHGSGSEEILLANGGSYRIAAAGRGGARGWTNDLVIIDELREMDSWEIIHAVEPTTLMSDDAQTVYLSNAGDDDSVVLNAVRDRATEDKNLAYIEWSAGPNRTPDDLEGWREANPAMGHYPQVRDTLDRKYLAHRLAGTLAIFETEHLCRWVTTMREPIISTGKWNLCEASGLSEPVRPVMAVSMDPLGRRASAAMAWRQPDDTIALTVLYDVPGAPIDTDALGKDMRDDARGRGVVMVGFDPMTDAQLGRYFLRSEPVSGQKFANASARFVALIDTGQLKWHDAAAVGADLTWTARKSDERGAFEAVRAQEERPITAALAAIRAVWLASEPARVTTSPAPSAMGY